jgi:hypothetical protein
METSDSKIDQCIKDHLDILQYIFPKYFSEAMSEKCKWITDQFRADSSQKYDFSLSLLKKTILTLYLILLLLKFLFLESLT